jgi:hypothetical protein
MLSLRVHQAWAEAKKVIDAECGKNKDKLALAELVALRQLARGVLAARTMTGLQSEQKGHKKRFTR